MRYELYSFHEENYYLFHGESEDIDSLLSYALKRWVSKWLAGIDSKRCQWIFLDNTPLEYNILSLGFTTAPTEEECRKRILACKTEKWAKQIETNETSGDLSTLITKMATKECEAICSKLFAYPPTLRFLISGNRRSISNIR